MTDSSKNGQPVCSKCGGIGWILSSEEHAEFGLVDYAERCPYCRKDRRAADQTGAPAEYSAVDISSFDFQIYKKDRQAVNMLKRIANGFAMSFDKWQLRSKGLYLWSKTPGSGKTFLACCLARSVSIKYDLRFRFTTLPDYLAALQASYKRPEGTEDETEIYRTCTLLVLDDVGSEKKGDWQRQELFRLVNSRTAEGFITIYTSNFNPEELQTADERTVDRIRKSSIVLRMPEESIRTEKAMHEQEIFLKELIS